MLRRVLPLALSVLVSVGVSRAQFVPVGDNAEHNNTRYAGPVTALAPIDELTLLIGTDGGGVWKTTDGGQSWAPKTDREVSLRITAITASPNGTRVYAATYEPARLLYSSNSGDTFTEILPNGEFEELQHAKQKVFRLLIDPDNTFDPSPGKDTLYAVTTKGLLRSTDGGSDWFLTAPPNKTLTDIAVIKGNSCRRLLATDGTDLYRSEQGIAWFDEPLPPPTSGPSVSPGASLVFAHQRPYRGGGVFFGYSGANDPLYDGSAGFTCTVTIDYVGRHPGPMVQGEAATYNDNGPDFVTASPTLTGESRLEHLNIFDEFEAFPGPYPSGINAVVAGSVNTREALYIGTDQGLWRYFDTTNGPDWLNLNGNLANLVTQHVHLSKNNFRAPIVDATNGLMTYRGLDWKISTTARTGDVFLRNNDANRGGAFLENTILQTPRLIRINNGITSSYSLTQCPRPTRGSFALDPTDPSDICAADGVVHCSVDGGVEWCNQSADIGAAEVVIVNGLVAWARTDDNRILRSVTSPVGNWIDVTNNLPQDLEILALTASHAEPQRAVIMGGTTTTAVQAYQTTDEGASWQAVGVPPIPALVIDPTPPPECTTIPCPDEPQLPRQLLSFGISYDDPNFPLGNPERWYVGTNAGLLISDLAGTSWFEAPDVPKAPVHDIDTSSGAVAVATGGRGLWVYDNKPQQLQPLPVMCDQWCHIRIPLPLPLPWASWLVGESNNVLSEVIEPRSGRVYRRGETAFGNSDFLITPGAAVIAHADSPVTMMIDGYPDESRPIRLESGWNAVGIPSVLTTSLEAVADAAAQGIVIEAIVEGVTPPATHSSHVADFDLSPTAAYWVFVCGDGGVWTPGAGSPTGP